MIPICVGIPEAAEMLSVCTKTVRGWVDDGALPTVKLPSVKYPGERGRRILILVDDLKKFAEAHREAKQ